jgi:uncharacterized protein (DUF433 family)
VSSPVSVEFEDANSTAVAYASGMSSDWIEIHPDVCNGRPVLRGTRIAVQSVLEMLAEGDSVEDVLEAFPTLNREQVLACLEHAARLMGNHYSFERVA